MVFAGLATLFCVSRPFIDAINTLMVKLENFQMCTIKTSVQKPLQVCLYHINTHPKTLTGLPVSCKRTSINLQTITGLPVSYKYFRIVTLPKMSTGVPVS
jgi:hypothetical protein